MRHIKSLHTREPVKLFHNFKKSIKLEDKNCSSLKKKFSFSSENILRSCFFHHSQSIVSIVNWNLQKTNYERPISSILFMCFTRITSVLKSYLAHLPLVQMYSKIFGLHLKHIKLILSPSTIKLISSYSTHI